MPHALPVPATSAFVPAFASAGSSGVTSPAPAGGAATVVELNEELRFDTGAITLRFEVHGRITVVDQSDGDRIGTGTVRTRSSVINDGRTVSAGLDHSVFRSTIVDGVFRDVLVVRQSRLRPLGDQCVAHLILRLEGNEVIVETSSMNSN